MDLDKVIKNRKSVRRFKDKKPDWRPILEAIDAAKYAPTAGNIFALKFILVESPESIQKIADASQQNFITQAKYVVVATSDPKILKNSYPEDYKKYQHQQAGAAIQNFLLALEERKLSTCWIGYFVEDQIKTELRIPENVDIIAVFPIGFDNENKKTRRQKPDLEEFILFDNYKNKKMRKESINV